MSSPASSLLTPASSPPQISSSYTTTTTITAPPSRVLQNGGGKLEKTSPYLEEDIRPEMKEDLYDPSYRDKEGPKPKFQYVWRNIILMSLLHVGALYGILLFPSCKIYTYLWGKRSPCPPHPVAQVFRSFNKVASYIEQRHPRAPPGPSFLSHSSAMA